MEEFFLKRLHIRMEMWQLGLALILAVVSIVGFGALVERAASNRNNAGLISSAALQVARIPADSKDFVKEVIFSEHPDLITKSRFEGETGFNFLDTTEHEGDLLLLARFDGDARRSTVELVDLDTGAVLHKYEPDINAIRISVQKAEKEAGIDRDTLMNVSRDHRPSHYGIYHPFIGEDGSLIFKAIDTPLVKVDACSRLEWIIYGAFHHAIERDSNGEYWTGGRTVPRTLEQTTDEFEEDAIVKFSSSGEVLFKKSIAQILLENDLQHLVYMGREYQFDPFHLNDIQPVLTDGPYWQQGDIFISLRNRSAILLYRPATNEVVWVKQGPWVMQHDIDIISDHEISVFSNNTTATTYGLRVVGTNDSIIYDFEDQTSSAPYREGFQRHKIKTLFQGLTHILPNDDIFVEEQGAGRLLVMDRTGTIKWSYVNRAKDGRVYHVQWSRYITGGTAIALRQLIDHGFECSS